MFDLKPDAPVEICGQYKPIATNIADLQISAALPQLFRMEDKLAILRSVAGMANEHDPTESDSGWSYNSLRSIGGRSGVGVMSRVEGATKRKMSFQRVFATIYRQLAINLNTTLLDPNGPPQYFLDDREPIEELI